MLNQKQNPKAVFNIVFSGFSRVRTADLEKKPNQFICRTPFNDFIERAERIEALFLPSGTTKQNVRIDFTEEQRDGKRIFHGKIHPEELQKIGNEFKATITEVKHSESLYSYLVTVIFSEFTPDFPVIIWEEFYPEMGWEFTVGGFWSIPAIWIDNFFRTFLFADEPFCFHKYKGSFWIAFAKILLSKSE